MYHQIYLINIQSTSFNMLLRFITITTCMFVTRPIPFATNKASEQNIFSIDFFLLAYLHCRARIQVLTRIRIPNLMYTLYYAKYVHIAQTQIWIPIQTQILISPIVPILGWISVTRLGLELVSGNVNKPFQYVLHFDVTSLILLPLDFI